jgi:NitT/TauT family transport system substrate-binding protein
MKTVSPLKKFLLCGMAFSLTLASDGAFAAEKITVRLDLYPWGIHAAMHLAKEKKWFDEAGLDVDIQDGTGTISTLQMVGAGKVDVGQVQLGNMAIAIDNGLDLISFAGFVRKGDLAVMIDEKSGTTTAKNLVGKKLVTFAASPWVPYIKPFLKAAGEEKTNTMMVAPTAMISTYASGNADGFMSIAPFGVPLVKKIRPARAILLSDSGMTFPSYGLVTTNEMLKKRGAVLSKLAQIQVRTWEYIYAGHIDEAVNAMIAQRPNAKLDPEVLRDQIVLYREFFNSTTSKDLRFGIQTDEDWNTAIRSMQQIGITKAGKVPSDYYTNALLSK